VFYLGRVLELLSIECIQEEFFALVSLKIGNEEVTFKWQIDSITWESLNRKIVGTSKQKYRLSLDCFLDKEKNGYYSFLTVVTSKSSETVRFTCSENYAKNINWINSLTSLQEFVKQTSQTNKIINKSQDSTKNKFGFRNKKVNKLTKSLGWAILLIGIGLTFFLNFEKYNVTETVSAENENILQLPRKENKKEVVPSNIYMDTSSKPEENILPRKENKKEVVPSNIYMDTSSKPEENIKSTENSSVLKLKQGVTYNLPDGYVALTFDDGPSIYTKEIVEILKQYNVGGTFFFVGNNVNKYPEYVTYVQSSGYSIGNHSTSHKELTKISKGEIKEEIDLTESYLKEITGQSIDLFRPPYGSMNNDLLTTISDRNFKTIMWNRDTEDWNSRDTNAIINYVFETESSGSIYLFHELEATVEALPIIIEHFQSQGLKIVSLQ
jgi:peptidoglycan/xylan/chitin deacetylase (PgdA/CDA1 family)